LWNLTTDKLLGELNEEGPFAAGNKDDIGIAKNRKFPRKVSEVLQTSQKTVHD
jgi:hypothetical protein